MSKKRKLALLIGVIGVVLIGSTIGVLYATRKKPQTLEEKALEACHDSMRSHLKAPGSAEWPTVNDQGVIVREHKEGEATLLVTTHVIAANSFGAKIRTGFSCYLKRDGDGWKVLNTELNQ